MQLLGLHALGDAGLPVEAEALGSQGPIGDVRILKGDHRLDPAHPEGHRLQIAPYLPDPLHRGLDLCGDAVLQPTAHDRQAAAPSDAIATG